MTAASGDEQPATDQPATDQPATGSSPYAVPLDQLESAVRVPAESLVESQADPAVPHDLPQEDMALGRPPRIFD